MFVRVFSFFWSPEQKSCKVCCKFKNAWLCHIFKFWSRVQRIWLFLAITFDLHGLDIHLFV
jgi:hypothetical protein